VTGSHSLPVARAMTALASLCGMLVVSAPAFGQSPWMSRSGEVAKGMNLVVRIQSGSIRGAGIVIGATRDSVYIVTAKHLWQKANWPSQMDVFFNFDRNHPIKADTVRRNTGPARDLLSDVAILAVPRAQVPQFDDIDFGRAYSESLHPRDKVMSIGCPSDGCWEVPLDEHVFVADREIAFVSLFIREGKSGGALLNEWGEVAGMVVTQEPTGTIGSAIPAGPLLRLLSRKDWKLPVQLKAPLAPRGGYRLSVGSMVLTNPSGTRVYAPRLELQWVRSGLINPRVAMIGVGSDSVQVVAPVAGACLSPPIRTLLLHLCIEGGAGRTTWRRDIGGIVIATGNGPRYEPALVTTQGFGFGAGGTGTLEFPIAPRMALALMGGTWWFQLPTGAPTKPSILFGGGFRYAIL
jgi:hypothetical protein